MFRPFNLLILFAIFASAILFAQSDKLVTKRVTYGPPHYTVADNAFLELSITASAYRIFDVETGEVFGDKNPLAVHEMASVTKLITAGTALSSSTIDASTTISWSAVATDGRAGNLEAGEKYRVRELLFPLLLESSNDAAEAIAEQHGRTKFISAMNEWVKESGMASTSVVDPSGLSARNVSTAEDLSKLLSYLVREQRHILDITTLPTYVGSHHTWQNNDPIVSSLGFIGGKHGYTDTAGRTIAVVFEERFRESDTLRPIGIILLDSDDLAKDVSVLREEFNRTVSYGYQME